MVMKVELCSGSLRTRGLSVGSLRIRGPCIRRFGSLRLRGPRIRDIY